MKLRLKASEIDRRRVMAGLLKGELAEHAGLHPNTVTAVLAGEPVGVVAARKIARALDLPLDQLIEDVVEAPVAACA